MKETYSLRISEEIMILISEFQNNFYVLHGVRLSRSQVIETLISLGIEKYAENLAAFENHIAN